MTRISESFGGKEHQDVSELRQPETRVQHDALKVLDILEPYYPEGVPSEVKRSIAMLFARPTPQASN